MQRVIDLLTQEIDVIKIFINLIFSIQEIKKSNVEFDKQNNGMISTKQSSRSVNFANDLMRGGPGREANDEVQNLIKKFAEIKLPEEAKRIVDQELNKV